MKSGVGRVRAAEKSIVNFEYEPMIRCVVCKHFSQSISCLFILLIVSIAVQKHFGLLHSYLSLLLVPKKSLWRPVSTGLSLLEEDFE
jgi:hypothetical protein